VYGGQLNDNGEPIRANAPSSTHRGIEVSGRADLGMGFDLSGNVSINDNTFDKFTEYDWSGGTIDRSGNVIAGFPKYLANMRCGYDGQHSSVSAHLFRAGRQYIDNSNSPEASIAPYTVVSVRYEIKLEPVTGWGGLSTYIQVNNLLGREYETGGYLDENGNLLFFPSARRNFYLGLRANL
jgi:outer membrane receptor protein involved in Fe transport